MSRSRTRLLPMLMALGLALAACGSDPGTGASATPIVEPTASPSVEPTPTPTEDPTPTQEPTPSDEPSGTPTPTPFGGLPGGFTVRPNADADALFLDRDTCMNERDNYQVTFPDDWWTNTEFGNGRYPACIWFSPTTYQVPSPVTVPDEIAITITWVEGGFGWLEPPATYEEIVVGAQPAVRVELEGPQGPGGTEPEDYRWYGYVIQLGPTPERGPNLVVETSTEMGGEYELNVAVMDRMMSTMEFFGSTQ